MVVPDWRKYIPGFLLCVAFAFVVMNIDHVLGKYHKADVASAKIPKLEKSLKEAQAQGDSEAVAGFEKQIKKQNKALDKVGGKVGSSWSTATFFYQTLQFK